MTLPNMLRATLALTLAFTPLAPLSAGAAVDPAGMNPAVQPGDDFFGYANGAWAKNTQIPADKSNYGMFTRLDDISRERTRVIIEEQAKDPASKIGLAYNAFLDSAAIEAMGLSAFQPWLAPDDDQRARSMLAGMHPILETPFGLDAAAVAKSGRSPLLSTGMVSADGRGLLGRGICAVPVKLFADAAARLKSV